MINELKLKLIMDNLKIIIQKDNIIVKINTKKKLKPLPKKYISSLDLIITTLKKDRKNINI